MNNTLVFCGREKELQHLTRLYAERKHVLIVGPAGIRLAVCRCFLGIGLSSFRICSIRHTYGPSFFFARGCACRYPGGALFSKIFFSVFQCSPVSLRICLLLVPSINTRRRISAHCSISVNILHVKLEVPHFSTAALLSATRRTFQPAFTPKNPHRSRKWEREAPAEQHCPL